MLPAVFAFAEFKLVECELDVALVTEGFHLDSPVLMKDRFISYIIIIPDFTECNLCPE
jgi:hypothetical protein